MSIESRETIIEIRRQRVKDATANVKRCEAELQEWKDDLLDCQRDLEEAIAGDDYVKRALAGIDLVEPTA